MARKSSMRLANGAGTVTKLSGKRRNPYIAKVNPRKVIDHDKKIVYYAYDILGYYPTKDAALDAIFNYRNNPINLVDKNILFSELYDRWSKEHFKRIECPRAYKAAFKHCALFHNLKFRDLRPVHIEELLNQDGLGVGTRNSIKFLLNQMYEFALRNEIVQKNYYQMCVLENKEYECKIKRAVFTHDEIELLWKNRNKDFADMVLIGIYTGFRPQELCELELKNVDFINWTLTGGMKTAAGKGRIIPIHPKIRALVDQRYNDSRKHNGDKLFWNGDRYIQYKAYHRAFGHLMKDLGLSHTPHDTRHTFATNLDNAEANLTCIKLLMGHSLGKDVTESVYIHKDLESLRKTIELLQ